MSHSLSASKHSGHPKRDTSPPKPMPILDEKASSMPNLDDCSRPTSAPPKLYSGSLFLYTNDPFGCFTKEHPDARDEEQYNQFFNYNQTQHSEGNSQKKQAPYSLGDTGTLEGRAKHNEIPPIAEAKSDLDISDMLSRQNSSLADGRFSPDRFDPSSSKAFMEVLDEGFGMHDNQEDNQNHSGNRVNSGNTPSNLTPTTTSTEHKKNLSGEGKSRGPRRSKGQVSPRKVEDNQHYGPGGHMMPPQMGYMQNPYYAQPPQPYMMSPEFHYVMADGAHRQGMQNYPVPMMNYYPYGVYPQNGPVQAPSNYDNNNYGKNANQDNSYNNSARKSKNEGRSKADSNASNNNNNKKSQQQSNSSNNNNNNANANNRKKNKKQTQEVTKQKSEKSNQSNTRSAESQGADPQDLERLINSAPKLAKDQAGCRMLQKQLELNDPEVTNRIFEKAIQEFSALMVDPFGNYLCQKLAEACSRDQMERIIKAASSSLISICFDPHGTRAVQKLIELVKEQDLIDMMVKYLSVDVVGLIQDNNGNHVIQKCLTHMSDKNKQFIYDSIMENCIEIATHKHGCCVIQRCLDHASKKQKDELVRVIVRHTLDLVKDQYGNYVVQYVLDLKDAEPRTNEDIANELSQDIVDLCKQKFSSNVVEKCLHLDLPNFKQHFIDTLLEEGVLVDLICDQFGNYVLQRCLTHVSDDEMNKILQVISENSEVIKNDVFGFKIYTKLCKNYQNLHSDRAKSNPPLSPLVSEGSTKNSDKTRAHSKAQSKKSTNSSSNKKNTDNRRHSNKNNEKRNQHHNNSRNQYSNNSHNSHVNNNQGPNMNYPPGYPMGQYGNPMPGPMMYSHPMQPSMMPPPNMGASMMQSDYYMQNTQMYNQYYNYPPPSQGHPGLYYGKNH